MERLKKLFLGFFYAFRGVGASIRTERNLRIHLTCLAYMLGFLLCTDWFVLTRTDWALLMLAAGAVLAAELFNTALEHTVDLATKEYAEHAKKAKDAAAGAVLVCAIFAVIVGGDRRAMHPVAARSVSADVRIFQDPPRFAGAVCAEPRSGESVHFSSLAEEGVTGDR